MACLGRRFLPTVEITRSILCLGDGKGSEAALPITYLKYGSTVMLNEVRHLFLNTYNIHNPITIGL